MSARTIKRGKMTRSKRGIDPSIPQQEKKIIDVQM
jgi:hypothetical protein